MTRARVAAVVATSLVVPVAIAAALMSLNGATSNSSSPPQPEVDGVHAALHDIDQACSAASSPPDRSRVEADVLTLVTFAERYGLARFAIDDETGNGLELLLVARDATRTCAPRAAALADAALPAEFREGLPKSS